MPNIAIVKYTSNVPENYIWNYLDLHTLSSGFRSEGCQNRNFVQDVRFATLGFSTLRLRNAEAWTRFLGRVELRESKLTWTF